MPLYQFYCQSCDSPYEIQMKLKTLEEYDVKRKIIKCPNCGGILIKLICPPKIIKVSEWH